MTSIKIFAFDGPRSKISWIFWSSPAPFMQHPCIQPSISRITGCPFPPSSMNSLAAPLAHTIISYLGNIRTAYVLYWN